MHISQNPPKPDSLCLGGRCTAGWEIKRDLLTSSPHGGLCGGGDARVEKWPPLHLQECLFILEFSMRRRRRDLYRRLLNTSFVSFDSIVSSKSLLVCSAEGYRVRRSAGRPVGGAVWSVGRSVVTATARRGLSRWGSGGRRRAGSCRGG